MVDSGDITATLRQQVRNLKSEGRKRLKVEYQRAISYLKGDQRNDVERLLVDRFPSTQDADSGQRIAPVVMPMVDRYVAEASTVYNRTVKRSLVSEDGTVNGEMTKTYNDALERAKYDEVMHANEKLTNLIKTSCVNFEAKRGELRPAIKYAHDVYPVIGDNAEFIEAGDPDDYAGFVVELFWADEDITKAQKRTFVHMVRESFTFYTGSEPDKPDKVISVWDNPYVWPQTIEELNPEDGTRKLIKGTFPGRMLTFWHTSLPIGELIIDSDPTIVDANRELNVAWSLLYDTLRFQSYAIPVYKTNKPDTKARRKWGARFPAVIGLDETFEMASAAVNYTEQVEVLKVFSKQLAVTQRASPNDFAIDQTAAISGFAKMVDSLPKIEARDDRIKRLLYLEQFVSWPRQCAVLVHLGILPKSAFGLKLRTEFDKITFPETQGERAKRIETDTKYNLTNPVDMLMKERGLTEDEAKETLLRNAQLNEEFGSKPQPQPVGGFGGAQSVAQFGGSIRQRRSQSRERAGDERTTARRDRQDRNAE